MSKPDTDDAPKPRAVELRHIHPARVVAEIFLRLACRHRQPRQRKLLIDYMLAGDGFDLAYTARVRRDRAFADLDHLARRLEELAKSAKGGGQ
jgi:hypothetical protein